MKNKKKYFIIIIVKDKELIYEKFRIHVCCRGGGALSSLIELLYSCKKNKICYDNDMIHHYHNSNKKGFTLAEVLITLGIIGVVAALTMPALIANHRNKVTETKLAKFYSVMNQAMRLAEVEYGDAASWVPQTQDDINGDFGEWYNTYLDKNIQSLSKETVEKYYHVSFSDGSGFAAYIPATSVSSSGRVRAYIFYCTDFKYCSMDESLENSGGTSFETNSYDGINTFLFSICENGKFVASSSNMCDTNVLYTREQLLNGCKNSDPVKRQLCTALIQHDGWKISKDYPWRKH